MYFKLKKDAAISINAMLAEIIRGNEWGCPLQDQTNKGTFRVHCVVHLLLVLIKKIW